MTQIGELTVMEQTQVAQGLDRIMHLSDALATDGVRGAHEIYRTARDILETLTFDRISREMLKQLREGVTFRGVVISTEVHDLVIGRNLIKAIKQIREETDLTLKDAKDLVEAYGQHLGH